MEVIDATLPRAGEQLDVFVASGRRQRVAERLGCAGAVVGSLLGLGFYFAGYFEAMVVTGLVAGGAYFLSTTMDASLEDSPRLTALREALAGLAGVLDVERALRLEFDLRAFDSLRPESKEGADAGTLDTSYRQRWLFFMAYGLDGTGVKATVEVVARQREDGIEVVSRTVEETLLVTLTPEPGRRVVAEVAEVEDLPCRDVEASAAGDSVCFRYVVDGVVGGRQLAAAIRACLDRVEPCSDDAHRGTQCPEEPS